MSHHDDYTTWLRVLATLDEARARWFVAQKAIELGRGGVKTVQELTGMSRPTIMRGIRELRDPHALELGARVRRVGGGRKRLADTDPSLIEDLERLMDEMTAGDPMSHLRWTNKSTAGVAAALGQLGHAISADTVARLLKERDYTLQANVKSKEGKEHPERDAQFHYINAQVQAFVASGDPVISVDTKKKERLGEFKNAGRNWRPKGQSRQVLVYDFPTLRQGSAIPYGTFDAEKNQGFVNVGTSHDTAEFAVESLRRWWHHIGQHHYPHAQRLLICADGGGSNGSRVRAWKFFLQAWADQLNLPVTVCHYPPGTSKWNKIEHRMFSFISLHWRGEPLVSYETVLNLINTTTTDKGLHIQAVLDEHQYALKKRISNKAMQELRIEPHTTHPRWNYTLSPREPTNDNPSFEK